VANQLVLSTSLSYAGNNVTVSETVSYLLIPTGNGVNSLSSFTATTSAIAIPLGSVISAGGWLFVKNNDPTNYVQVKTSTGGTVFARLLSGEFCLLRLDASITAPAVIANTASCSISFCIFDS
jgi:hypothetical protein